MDSPEAPALRRKLKAFIDADTFDDFPAYARLQEKVLEKAGLFEEDPQTIVQMKIMLMEHKNANKGRGG